MERGEERFPRRREAFRDDQKAVPLSGKPPLVMTSIAAANIDEVARTTRVAPLIPIGCASRFRSPAPSRRANVLKTLAWSCASNWSG